MFLNQLLLRLRFFAFCFGFLPRLLLVQAFGFFFGVEVVVELEEAFEDLLAGVGVDGVADAVVFGEVVPVKMLY